MNDGDIQRALEALAGGRPVVVVDDEDRENEGDLVLAAEFATTETVAFFLQHTSGFLCVSIPEARADQLDLALMVADNTERQGTAFTVSVDALDGTTTGISASDRATTIRALSDPASVASDFARPGHVMPLRSRPGGVLSRDGHTEAGVDLCLLAGLQPAALICELVSEDRRDMMRWAGMQDFARRHDLPLITIAQLIQYRRCRGSIVTTTGTASIPTAHGVFDAIAFTTQADEYEHLTLVMGDLSADGDPLVRVHSECLTGETLGSLLCDCGQQFERSLQQIAAVGRGVLIYLRGHEGRGIGLGNKLRAYRLQQVEGVDTVEANVRLGLPIDDRQYGTAAAMLHHLGVRRLRLLTNNPRKCDALVAHGLAISERVPLEVGYTADNLGYLMAKRGKLGHRLTELPAARDGTPDQARA
jgi:3,4-dihydroxy 2-butanone 4-phosphate synthase / GTP cyclohydrolase II